MLSPPLLLGRTFRVDTCTLRETRTYLLATLFVLGNVALPSVFHQFAMGGPTFLPLYFFVLVGALVYGPAVGILTGILSPLASHFLTGMPPTMMLAVILMKSLLLAVFAAYTVSHRYPMLGILTVIVGYQTIGGLFEAWYWHDLSTAFMDIQIGTPWLLLQIITGYLTLRILRPYAR